MLLTIHNLPSNTCYTDVKVLLKTKCDLTDGYVLDNLVVEGTNKKVTVGLADEEDAAVLTRKLNGVYVNGLQLYVQNVRKNKKTSEQPYSPSTQGAMNMAQDTRNLPANPVMNPNPWMMSTPYYSMPTQPTYYDMQQQQAYFMEYGRPQQQNPEQNMFQSNQIQYPITGYSQAPLGFRPEGSFDNNQAVQSVISRNNDRDITNNDSKSYSTRRPEKRAFEDEKSDRNYSSFDKRPRWEVSKSSDKSNSWEEDRVGDRGSGMKEREERRSRFGEQSDNRSSSGHRNERSRFSDRPVDKRSSFDRSNGSRRHSDRSNESRRDYKTSTTNMESFDRYRQSNEYKQQSNADKQYSRPSLDSNQRYSNSNEGQSRNTGQNNNRGHDQNLTDKQRSKENISHSFSKSSFPPPDKRQDGYSSSQNQKANTLSKNLSTSKGPQITVELPATISKDIKWLSPKAVTWRGQAASFLAKETFLSVNLNPKNKVSLFKRFKDAIRTKIETLGKQEVIKYEDILLKYREKHLLEHDQLLLKKIQKEMEEKSKLATGGTEAPKAQSVKDQQEIRNVEGTFDLVRGSGPKAVLESKMNENMLRNEKPNNNFTRFFKPPETYKEHSTVSNALEPFKVPGPFKAPGPSQAPGPSKAPGPSQAPGPSKAPEPSKAPGPFQAPGPSKAPEHYKPLEPSVMPKPFEMPKLIDMAQAFRILELFKVPQPFQAPQPFKAPLPYKAPKANKAPLAYKVEDPSSTAEVYIVPNKPKRLFKTVKLTRNKKKGKKNRDKTFKIKLPTGRIPSYIGGKKEAYKQTKAECRNELLGNVEIPLVPIFANALEDELEPIAQIIRNACFPSGKKESYIFKKIQESDVADEFKRSLKIQMSKRLANKGFVSVRIFGTPKLPRRSLLADFLHPYNVISLRSAKFRSMYVAECWDYVSADRLFNMTDAVVDGKYLSFKPLQLVAPPSKLKTLNIQQLRAEFIKSQIDSEDINILLPNDGTPYVLKRNKKVTNKVDETNKKDAAGGDTAISVESIVIDDIVKDQNIENVLNVNDHGDENKLPCNDNEKIKSDVDEKTAVEKTEIEVKGEVSTNAVHVIDDIDSQVQVVTESKDNMESNISNVKFDTPNNDEVKSLPEKEENKNDEKVEDKENTKEKEIFKNNETKEISNIHSNDEMNKEVNDEMCSVNAEVAIVHQDASNTNNSQIVVPVIDDWPDNGDGDDWSTTETSNNDFINKNFVVLDEINCGNNEEADNSAVAVEAAVNVDLDNINEDDLEDY